MHQNGSGTNDCISSYRSTQKPSVGVWQGPYEIMALSRFPYLPTTRDSAQWVSYNGHASIISMLTLEISRLKPAEGHPDLQIQLLPSIDSFCLVFIWLDQSQHRFIYILLCYGGKSSSEYSISMLVFLQTHGRFHASDHLVADVLTFSVAIEPED